jgi:hypothetical protein
MSLSTLLIYSPVPAFLFTSLPCPTAPQVSIHRYERDKGDSNPCLLEMDMAMDNKDNDETVTTAIML